jgi:hypothetical protein
MAGEIKLNSVNFASESGGTITVNNGTIGSAVAMSANHPAVKTALNASGDAPVYACRAWVNFDGTTNTAGFCTIRDSGNVTSITDNGTGQYTVNFGTAMPDANYNAVAMGTQKSGIGNNGTVMISDTVAPTSSALRILCSVSNSAQDLIYVNVAIFR